MRQKIISLVSSDLENGSGMNRKRFGVDSFSPRKLFTLLFVLLLGVGQMWGTEELYYTLTPANGSNNSYASNCDIAISGITWNLEGNSQVQPWKLGANNKTALSNTDRSIYSKTAIDEDITKIEITHGAASNITVNSMTVIVSKNSNFSSPVSTLTPTFAANNTVTVYRPNGKDWSNCYYKITYNLTGAKSSANTIQFTNAKFYHEVGGGSTPTVLDVPTGMSSGTPGMTSTTLSWNAVANASGYALTIGTNSPITSGFTTSAGVVSYNLTGLDAETSYTWKVKAVGDGENYSDSEDCATQNFTTAEDPSQMTLTFGLTSNPGGWPTTNSTTTTNYTYTLNAVNYSFALNNVKCNSGYLMMTKTAILGLPAIANYKLVKVVASNSGGCSTSTNVAITSAQAASPVVTGGTGQTWSSTSSNYTYNLSGTDYNTVYYMYVTSANAQVTQLKLTYKPKPAVSSISIKTAPTKTTYTANENFDPSGLVITVNYDDATSEDVTYGNSTAANFTFSPSTSTALNATNTSVTVTYGTKTANQAITVNRIATSLAWSPTSYTVNYGAVYSFPTLTKTPNNLSGVTYSSSNTDVATINETTGAISVVGTGSTTITASFAQTNVYSAATPATYTLTINSASSPTLEVDPTSLTFDLTAVGSNRTDIVTLEGEFLAANATYEITGDDKAMFSVVDPTFPLTPEGGELLEDITIKYAPTAAAANHTATLTITSGVASATVTLSGSAKVKRTVTWYKADDTELTAQERGSATTEVWDGDAVTVLPSAPASCDASISFQGWTNATYAKSDDAPTILFTDAEDAPEISGGNASYYAVWANTSGSGGNVVINASVDGYPTTYGSKNAFDDLEVSGIDFKIQQLTTNSSNMQWRASGNENGTGTIYNNEAFPGHITSIVVVFASTDANRNHTLKIGDSANPTGGTAITPSISNTYTYTFDCSAYNFDYFVLTNGTNAGYTSSVTINYAASVGDYATTCSVPVVIADPTFSPAAGSYDNDQSVEISAAQGMTIKYSIGADSNPKTNGTTYSSAISVTEDKVIKAVATDGNGNYS